MTNPEEEIIKCAEAGGYKVIFPLGFWTLSYFLDPLFWEAIGRAKGWENGEEYNGSNYETSYQGECKTNALRFMEINLTQGWQPAIEYLYSLISNK